MGHDHGCGRGVVRAGARHQRRLVWSFGLILAFFVVEAITGAITGSLALISDAGHMFTDVIGLGMAVAAIQLATRAEAGGPADRSRTFGLYRLEILAAFVNALLLFGVAIFVLVEAARRISDPPDILSTPLLVVAVLGLAVNLVAFALLRRGAKESLNVEGAYLEVLADALGSVAVIVAAVVIELTGWTYIDPILGAGIGLFILPRTWRLGRQSVRILIQAGPPEIDPTGLQAELACLQGVVDVHDLHLWTLASGMEVASAHLMVAVGTDSHRILDQARQVLEEGYGIDHATLQVEPADHRGCDEMAW
ncbi:MAG TPA: cation diffusion facilitator family transporter [Acidimicrobiales bacterium]|jgi:cobalt-zinc-cadmium efflux system protein|nr:cation diffusion facilitator family transporter [Acidimicrobiales bacterium]